VTIIIIPIADEIDPRLKTVAAELELLLVLPLDDAGGRDVGETSTVEV
jgi:hypothetical protein